MRVSAHPGPAPRAYPFVGHLPAVIRRGLLTVLVDLAGRRGSMRPLRLGFQTAHVATHPDHMRTIGVERQANFIKGTALEHLRILLGNGLVTADGEVWKRGRKLAAPAFRHDKLAGLVELAAGPVTDMLDEWDSGPATATFDCHSALKRMVFRISGLTLFGSDLGEAADEATRSFGDALHEITRRIERTYSLPMAVPTPGNVRLERAVRILDRHVQAILDRRADVEGADVLASFLRARRERPGEVSDRQLRDEILTLYLAGHDATSHTLTWVLHFAALYPEVQERMRDEARRASSGGAGATPDLARLPYTRRVVEETLRVMPAASVLARQVVEDDEIDGVRLPAGSWVVLSPFVTHHLPEFWPDPDRFDPDRFSPERSKDRHPFAYCPFGLGPRTCIGNHLAMAELVTIAAMLLPRYELSHVPGAEVTPIWRATLQPKDGLALIRRRIRSASERAAAGARVASA